MVQTNVEFRVRYGAFRYSWILHIEFNSVSFSLSLLWCFNCNVRATTTKILKDQICRYSRGDDSRAANFDVNRWHSEWIFTRRELLDFECWAEKAIAKVLFWQSFPLISAVHFLGKMVVLHILNLPRLIASFEEAKLLWSFGLVRKAEFSLSFPWSFSRLGSRKNWFLFLQIFSSLWKLPVLHTWKLHFCSER